MSLRLPHGFRGVFRNDAAARAVYSEAAGIARILPHAVAVPADIEDLVTLVRHSAATHAALIPRGSGSGMPGGAIGEGVIVDLSRWDHVGDVNVSARSVRVGPGAIRADVDRAARRHGLRLPVDPSSGAFCTIGGMASTNAAGAHSMHFGSMRRWVRAIDCVLADGTRAEVRRGGARPDDHRSLDRFLVLECQLSDAAPGELPRHAGVLKDSSGYAVAGYACSGDLVDLLVGSEGTLAFF
ncbi:MAG TPA: FAD-binding oxidoreductase, partial [Gemmatimonadaceae bacterium]